MYQFIIQLFVLMCIIISLLWYVVNITKERIKGRRTSIERVSFSSQTFKTLEQQTKPYFEVCLFQGFLSHSKQLVSFILEINLWNKDYNVIMDYKNARSYIVIVFRIPPAKTLYLAAELQLCAQAR